MELGKFDIEGGRGILSDRRYSRGSESEGSGDKFVHDLPRLCLFLLIMIGFVIGVMRSNSANDPVNIIARSVSRTLDRQFMASLEGSVSLKGITLESYRERQYYKPGGDLSRVTIEGRGGDVPSHDILEAIGFLKHTEDITEYDREDMYGHGTRHFDGILGIPDIAESELYAFEVWCDLRTNAIVRLIVTRVERNAGVDADGNSVSRETYLNFWLHY